PEWRLVMELKVNVSAANGRLISVKRPVARAANNQRRRRDHDLPAAPEVHIKHRLLYSSCPNSLERPRRHMPLKLIGTVAPPNVTDGVQRLLFARPRLDRLTASRIMTCCLFRARRRWKSGGSGQMPIICRAATICASLASCGHAEKTFHANCIVD